VKADFDLVILGSGFGGSLLAMLARQLGRSVLLLERERHPRFVIGESTTPLTNLIWAELTDHYDLDELVPLSKWGTWQEQYPEVAVGLKRGFSFYHHQPGRTFTRRESRDNELLIAASSRDAEADTHWYRPDFDRFLVERAQARNVDYSDLTAVRAIEFAGDNVRLAAHRSGRDFHVTARFVVDASGPRGALFNLLGLPEAPMNLLPATAGLYTHFRGVRKWESLFPSTEPPPYPVDAAALHHVFDGGWIWVLPFNNGITSAGVSCRLPLDGQLRLSEGLPAWQRLLERLPSVREQFADATIEFPFIHVAPLSFRAGPITGPRWALLPSAGGFIDPLLSTGFPLTLLGIERLVRILEEDWGRARFEERLRQYESRTRHELDRAEQLIAALYAAMGDFQAFSRLSLLYFAAAAFTERARRQRRPDLAGNLFLLGEHASFGPGLTEICHQARELYATAAPSTSALRRLRRDIDAVLEPVDLGGLRHDERRNWHPLESLDP
jgi:tetracycline 7-halogenase / FADH2 O2-dependent halogenase